MTVLRLKKRPNICDNPIYFVFNELSVVVFDSKVLGEGGEELCCFLPIICCFKCYLPRSIYREMLEKNTYQFDSLNIKLRLKMGIRPIKRGEAVGQDRVS